MHVRKNARTAQELEGVLAETWRKIMLPTPGFEPTTF